MSDQRKYVVYTGLHGYFLFNLAMQGLELPKNIKYSHVTFKRIHKYIYINIGNKHDKTKIIINTYDHTYTACLGTEKLGTYNTVNEAVTKLRRYI